MKTILRRLRPSPAMVVACTALFFAMTGAGYAAGMLGPNTVGSKQLKSNAVISSKVKNRSLLAADFKAGQLPQGLKGDPGAPGAPGAPGQQGPQGILSASSSRRALGTVAGGATAFVFVGETQNLTLGAGQSIVGVATGQLTLYGRFRASIYGFSLCYRAGAGPVTRFLSNENDFQVAGATNVIQSNTAAAAVQPACGHLHRRLLRLQPKPQPRSGVTGWSGRCRSSTAR